jgi:Domain of unknown function (DUF4340)
MNIKKEYLILVAIILVLSLYIIFYKRDKSHYRLPELPKVMQKEISKVEISKQDTTLVLNKRDNRWGIEPQGYPADANQVKSMLDVIEKLTLTALASESKNYERYKLDGDNKVIVKAWAGDTLRREFEIGKAATTFQHTFVKLSDDYRVYHARGNFRRKFDQTSKNLQDKIVLSFVRSEIKEIHITKGEQSMTIGREQGPVEVNPAEEPEGKSPQSQKGETVWFSADGKRVDESRLDRLLAILSNLRCEKYLDGSKKDDFTNPIYTLRLQGTQDYTLSIFAKMDKDAKNYPAMSSENDFPFLLPGHQVDEIMTNPDEVWRKPDKS